MTKKYIITSLTSLVLVSLFYSTPIYAENEVREQTKIEQENRKNELRQQALLKNLETKKLNAQKEIDRRIVSLDSLIAKINDTKLLSQAQKDQLVLQVSKEITNLQNLKSKIISDSNLETLNADKQQIIQSYRIYALFLPEINIIVYGDKIISLAQSMTEKNPSPEALIKINEATSKAQAAIDSVLSLSPDGYPGNKTILQSARNQLEIARSDLNAGRVLMKKSAIEAK